MFTSGLIAPSYEELEGPGDLETKEDFISVSASAALADSFTFPLGNDWLNFIHANMLTSRTKMLGIERTLSKFLERDDFDLYKIYWLQGMLAQAFFTDYTLILPNSIFTNSLNHKLLIRDAAANSEPWLFTKSAPDLRVKFDMFKDQRLYQLSLSVTNNNQPDSIFDICASHISSANPENHALLSRLQMLRGPVYIIFAYQTLRDDSIFSTISKETGDDILINGLGRIISLTTHDVLVHGTSTFPGSPEYIISLYPERKHLIEPMIETHLSPSKEQAITLEVAKLGFAMAGRTLDSEIIAAASKLQKALADYIERSDYEEKSSVATQIWDLAVYHLSNFIERTKLNYNFENSHNLLQQLPALLQEAREEILARDNTHLLEALGNHYANLEKAGEELGLLETAQELATTSRSYRLPSERKK